MWRFELPRVKKSVTWLLSKSCQRFGTRNPWCLCRDEPRRGHCSCEVRSSATAEDLPDASFAGQQETFLNIRGIDNILIAIKKSLLLYTMTAPSLTAFTKVLSTQVLVIAGVQRMVRSETGTSGVMFTIDTESGLTMWYLSMQAMVWVKWWCKVRWTLTEFTFQKALLNAGKPAVFVATSAANNKNGLCGRASQPANQSK